MPILDPFDALAFSVHENPGVYALLVGSGLSRSAGIPTGWEVTLNLIERLGAIRGVRDHADWPGWYKEEYGEEPDYSELLDALASTPAERRNILHGYIEASANDDLRRPTHAHHAIARLVADGFVRVIVTPNFDRLLETALRETGVEPSVIASEDAVAGATPLVHARCTVIKVHGDYHDTRIRNTRDELAAFPPRLNALLDEVFDRFGLVSVGWSGDWDEALRAAILRAPTRRYPFYWVRRGSITPLAQDLVDQRAGRVVVTSGADEFFGRLADAIGALADASRPHPQSVAMAVALAKKYCRDDQYAAEWAALVADQTKQIAEFFLGPDFPTQRIDGKAIGEFIAELASRSEALRRICLVGGRWGTDQSKRTLVRSIRSMVPATPRDGLVALLDLREAAAAFCFYWLLAGSLEAEDFASIRLAMHEEAKISGETKKLVEALPLRRSDGVWGWAPGGVNGSWAPWSDYLARLLAVEGSDISLMPGDAGGLLAGVEFLIAAEATHLHLERQKKQKDAWFSFPMGKFVFRDDRAFVQRRLVELSDLRDDAPLLKSGLLGGSRAHAALVVDAFKKEISGRWN